MVVFDQVAEGVPEAGGNEIRGEAEEDGRFISGFRITERALQTSPWLVQSQGCKAGGGYHFIDNAGRLGDRSALKTSMSQIVHHFGHCDISALELVEIHAAHNVRSFWDWL